MNVQELQDRSKELFDERKGNLTQLTGDLMDNVVNSEIIKKVVVISARYPEKTKEQLKELLEGLSKTLTESKAVKEYFKDTADILAYQASAQWWITRCICVEHIYKNLILELVNKCGSDEEFSKNPGDIQEWVETEFRKGLEEKGFSVKDTESVETGQDRNMN